MTAFDPKAKITVDGKPAGVGHVEVELIRNREHYFSAAYNGETANAVTTYQLSTLGGIDTGTSFVLLFPIIGLFFPGAWDIGKTNIQLDPPPTIIPYSAKR